MGTREIGWEEADSRQCSGGRGGGLVRAVKARAACGEEKKIHVRCIFSQGSV